MSQTPRTIDRYTLIRELGRGGMGVVYEVHDPALGRPLALKQMLQGVADAESLLRFAQESELLARVSHPNVVQIHGLGRSAEGPYIVTERVEGTPLDRVLSQGPLAPRRAAAVVRDLSAAVTALHAAGVIHRDLKPENVILRADGAPVLIDFGIARDERAERLTLTGDVLGTPHYMSPEQALGDTHTVGTASDVYGLGAVLFALLAGVAPFAGVAKAGHFAAITTLEPAWPEGVKRQIPPTLDAICRRAMSKDPEDRPDAPGLVAELDGFLNAEPTGSLGWPLAVACGASLLVIVGVLAFRPNPPPSAPSVPAPTAPVDSAVAVPPGVSPTGETVDRLCRGLRTRPSAPALLRQARELLARSDGAELDRLRHAYVKACLTNGPVLVSQHGADIPERGMARWFDDQRIVASSREVRALWLWSDYRSAVWERVGYVAGGIPRNAAPEVLGSLVFVGGGEPSARCVLGYRWGEKTPAMTLATKTPASSLATWAGGSRQLLAVGTQGTPDQEQGTIVVFDLQSGQRLTTLRGHRRGISLGEGGSIGFQAKPPEVRALRFSTDGRWLVSGGYAGELIVWDVASWKRHRQIRQGDALIQDITLHPTRPLMAVSLGVDQEISVLRVPDLKESQSFRVRTQDYARGAHFSRDGRLVFAISGRAGKAGNSKRGEVLAYELETGRLIHKRVFRDQTLNSLDLSPDGRRLVTYSRRGDGMRVLEVWEIDVPPRR